MAVTLSGSQSGATTTAADGSYSFNLPADLTYTLTPSFLHYTFNPPALTISNLISNQTVDFSGSLNRYKIVGRVTNTNNYGIGGVSISLSGSVGNTTTTDSNGDFSFPNLPEGGTYTVSPVPKYYSFDKASYAFDNLIADRYAGFIANLNYHTISGGITKSDGSGISGGKMRLRVD